MVRKTVEVKKKQCGWKNNSVKKVNLANNAIEHWEINFTFVIINFCFFLLGGEKIV